LKFTDFKIGYHDGTLSGIQSHAANRPIELPNDYRAVVRALEARAEAAHTAH
jgi:threonine synthase